MGEEGGGGKKGKRREGLARRFPGLAIHIWWKKEKKGRKGRGKEKTCLPEPRRHINYPQAPVEEKRRREREERGEKKREGSEFD